MKQALFCVSAAILFTACNKPEAAEDTPESKPLAAGTTPAPAAPAAQDPKISSGDWMWKNSKGKPRETDPFKIKNDPLKRKASPPPSGDNPLEVKPKH